MSTSRLRSVTERGVNRRTLLKGSAVAGITVMAGPNFKARAQDTIRLAFSVPGLNFPFFVHMMNLAEQHSASIGGIEFRALDGQEAGQPSSTKQSNDIEAIIADDFQALVISPNDTAALAPAIESAIEAGLVVVTVDRNVTDVATLAHVGADNVRGGELQGEYLLQILPDGGRVFELQGQPGATPAIDRHTGLLNIIDQQDAVQIVFSQTANFARDQALTLMESALEANDPPDAIVCANDDMAFGVIEALSGANLSIPVLGFDALPEALQAIQAGQMAATIEQFPGGQATQAIDIAVAKLREGADPAQHDTYLTPINITAENLGQAERAAEAGIEVASPVASPTA